MTTRKSALKLAALLVFLFAVLIMFAPSVYASDAYEYTGAGDFDFSEQDPKEVITIPGTNLRAGMFRYNFDKDYKDGVGTFKAGILVEGNAFYYPDDTGEAGSMDPGGDCNFGVYKDIFLMDCYPYGASHNRMMFVFRFGKKIELLDVTGVYTPEFWTLTIEEQKLGSAWSDYKSASWMDIKDYDGDGKPEVPVEAYLEYLSLTSDYINDPFIIYLEIRDDALLHVLPIDLNPVLYKPLFEQEKKKNNSEKKSNAYYVYGFLSHALTLGDIRVDPVLRSDKEQYRSVVKFLEQKSMQDPAYTYPGWKKPITKKYDLKRR